MLQGGGLTAIAGTSLYKQFSIFRATIYQGFLAESTFFDLYRLKCLQTFLGQGENMDFGYVVRDAGRMTSGTQDSPFWCPQYWPARQQWDLACWVTGANNHLDVLTPPRGGL